MRLIVLLLALLAPFVAYGHAHLVQSTPADGAVVAESPDGIALRFSEGVEARFSSFALYRLEQPEQEPAGAVIELGKAETQEGGMLVILPLAEDLDDGHYALQWKVLARDGHSTSGVVRFIVDEP